MKLFCPKKMLAICMAAVMLIGIWPVDVLAEEHQTVSVEEDVGNVNGAPADTGGSFETAIDITDAGMCDIVVSGGESVYVKYTSAETAKMVLGMTRTVEKNYLSNVVLEMYEEQDAEKFIEKWNIYAGTDTVNNDREFEQGKTYVFKISVSSSDSTDTSLAFSVKKNTLTYEGQSGNFYINFSTEPGAEPVLEIKNVTSSLEDAVITYQWYEGKSSSSYAEIDGAADASYQLPPITASSFRYYRCRVSDGNVFMNMDFYLAVRTGLQDGAATKRIIAMEGSSVVLDPKRNSASEAGITYRWSKYNGNSYESITDAEDATYSFTMSEETAAEYKCSLNDGYQSATVTFDVRLPEITGDLQLDTDITVESDQTALYTFTPAVNGFYKKAGWGDAALYDKNLNEIDTFDLNSGSYLRAGEMYYVSLSAGSGQQTYQFTLLEQADMPDTIVKAGYLYGRIWSLDGGGVLRYSGSGSIDGADYAGLEHVDAAEIKEIVFEDGITGCGSGNYAGVSFGKCKNLTKVSFAATVASIGQGVFQGCSSLREVVFAEGSQISDIAAGAFDGTPYIAEQTGDFILAGTIVIGYTGTDASATIPEKATILGSGVMRGSENLENLYILDQLKKINQFSVADCEKLPSVEVPGNVTDIGYCAFYSDTALENVVLNEGVKNIDREAFFACRSLKEITIPKSVTYIGQHAIGYERADYRGIYTLNEELPIIKCYYNTSGYSYAKSNGLPYELLDKKDLSQGSPLVKISFSTLNGKPDRKSVYFAGDELTEGKDFTADYTDDGKTYKLVIKGIGEYFGEATLTGESSSSGTSGGTETPGNPNTPGGTNTSGDQQGHTHSYPKVSTIQAATALQEGKEKWSCSCGDTITKTLPKLKATGTVTASKVTLQVKKSVTLKVTNLAKGDSVKEWNSKNKKIATVNKNGKVTAKKTGSTKLTVTLASGKKLTVSLKVTAGIVKTTKLKLSKSSLNLKRNKKYTLKCTVTPFNSQEKVTYSSSNKKIATVSSKGVITAKKKGKVSITAKSGKKKAVCKITVK